MNEGARDREERDVEGGQLLLQPVLERLFVQNSTREQSSQWHPTCLADVRV